MSIVLPTTSGNVIPEYAATSITFNRQIQNINGVLTAVFIASIPYERKDYLVVNGVKVGIVSPSDPMISTGMADPTRYGSINLNTTQLSSLFSQIPPTGQVIGEVIADMADSLIRSDLIARGIITA